MLLEEKGFDATNANRARQKINKFSKLIKFPKISKNIKYISIVHLQLPLPDMAVEKDLNLTL